MKAKISIIGGGNLGKAMAEGILKSGLVPPSNIKVSRRRVELLNDLAVKGVVVGADNEKIAEGADIIILAVQPQQVEAILKELENPLKKKGTVLVSVVTGFTISKFRQILGKEIPVFRAMPNTAVSIGESMTCIAGEGGSSKNEEDILALFETVGVAILIEEEMMASATVLGACGIAYAMRFIRAASQGGIEIGFDADLARKIASQTAKGAAALLLQKGTHPEEEIDKVTTPMGCTIAGLNEMEHRGFSSALIRGVTTSYRKIMDVLRK